MLYLAMFLFYTTQDKTIFIPLNEKILKKQEGKKSLIFLVNIGNQFKFLMSQGSGHILSIHN